VKEKNIDFKKRTERREMRANKKPKRWNEEKKKKRRRENCEESLSGVL